ncbi:MAG: hypothetical protein HPY61_02195 [Methanotrichaceae archaeon]|nr:hypothetical protein [Methanotrichaceae archaeon]
MRSWMIILGLIAVLVSSASAGKFQAELDVDTYMDQTDASQSFDEEEVLWATSVSGVPENEVYLSFINNFGAVGVFSPDSIESATLTIYASDVEIPGEVTAYLAHEATLPGVGWEDKPEYISDISASVEIAEEGEYAIDITSLIEKAVELCVDGCPYSIVLVADGDASIGFASQESSEEGASLQYITPE